MTNPGLARLSIEDLCVDLGGQSVLEDVSLDIHPGSFIGLLGPNGAGKTTLIRAMLGLIPHQSGTIIMGETTRDSGYAGMGYVPQRHEFAWDFPISVERTVMTGRSALLGLFRRPKSADWDVVYEVLDLVGLIDQRQQPIGQLSGGQRQRVLVARALATQPTILLLDEPFTGLDMPTQELLIDLLAQLVDRGTSVVMSTHDILSAITHCNELVLLNRRVLATGHPTDLRQPELWQQTFGVSANNPLLKLVEVVG